MSSNGISKTNKSRNLKQMFRKQVKIPPNRGMIDHSTQLITLGSCFSESIGEKLKNARMNVLLNPFGTIFHPLALANAVNGLNMDQTLWRDNYYFHWQLGGSFFNDTAAGLLKQVTELNADFQQRLATADVVVVTFGTAWGYEHKELKSVVANCHKMPQELFEKKLFGVEEILVEWKNIVSNLQHVHWVFTVSPVRHWKDGVRENNVSKGILHQVVHELLKEQNVSYFPAYELLLDELRDYRFYKGDYLHPSDEAVAYIWQRLGETCFSPKTQDLVVKIEHLEVAKNHRLMYPASEERKKFLKNLESQEAEVQELLSKYLT